MLNEPPDIASVSEPTITDPRLRVLADEIRSSGILGRALLMKRLFDFLVDRSAMGQAVKEIELAQAVFRQGADVDLMQDASVRVYVHRLRRKLDDYYADRPVTDRLIIRKGEYRLTVAEGGTSGAPAAAVKTAWWRIIRRKAGLSVIMTLLVLMGVAAGAYLGVRSMQRSLPPAAGTSLWAFLGTNGRPTFIVVGDYYAFGMRNGDAGQRLVLDPGIRSSAELEQYIMAHPRDADHYTMLDAHYLAPGTAFAIRSLLPLIDMNGRGAGPVRVTLMSDLTPDVMKGANIIYVGAVDGLGKLDDLVFRRSRFRVNGQRKMLIDRRSLSQISLGTAHLPGKDRMTREYAYIATFDGPSNSRFVIIAGSGDAATKQAAETAVDAGQIVRMSDTVKGKPNFEALWQVNTFHNVAYSTALLSVSPMARGD